MSQQDRLVWIDLEMTGLDPKNDTIIEIATIVTDSDLNLIAEGPVLAVYQTDEALSVMDDWNIKHHGESGLIDRVKASNISLEQAQQQTIDFLALHVPNGASPLCGNSIGQDRRFLVKYMPILEDYFHYRNVDVSTVKELARRWAPEVFSGVKKKNTHQALDDIRESIEELRHYREHFFKL
jgi:oligoribonuclease